MYHTFVINFSKIFSTEKKSVSTWAGPWENMSYVICEQLRCRSACAFAQSVQSLCCSLLRQYNISRFYSRNFMPLASFCGCAGQFVSGLVGNSRRHVLSCRGSHMGRVKWIWYLSPMRAVMVQKSLCIHAVSPEPPLLAHTSCESRRTFRQKARSLAHLNGWACTVKICHDGMLEDTNSLDVAHILR